MANIEIGIPEEDQEGSFMNATLQSVGDVAFSIQTDFDIPEDVGAAGEVAVERYLAEQLAKAEAAVPGIRFTVQLGEARGYEPANSPVR